MITRNLDEKYFRVQEAEEDLRVPLESEETSFDIRVQINSLFMNNVLAHPDRVFEYGRLHASSVTAILA